LAQVASLRVACVPRIFLDLAVGKPMGRLKDTLHLEVWKHLKTQPQCRTLLLALNSPGIGGGRQGPQEIRHAWQELKTNGKADGEKMNKTTGLQAVLMERPDLFQSETNEKGHLLISIRETARELSPEEVVVPRLMVESAGEAEPGSGGFSAEQEALQASLAASLQDFDAEGWQADQEEPAPAESAASTAARHEPLAKKQRTDFQGRADPRSGKGIGSGKGGTKGKNGLFQDIVWTPAIAAAKAEEKRKDAAIVRALFNAIEMHGGGVGGSAVTLSQIGSDYNVAQLKKESKFKKMKLLDILKFYEDVFELTPDGVTGGYVVKLHPGAEAALPDAETFFGGEIEESDLMLPERLEDPRSLKEKMQALRVELIHALHRRGRKVALQELGQEPKVQQSKSLLHKAQKLIDFIKLFPDNFAMINDDASMIIELVSMDVYDQSMIDASLLKNSMSMSMASKFKGGKGRSALGGGHFRPHVVAPPHRPVTDLGYGRIGAPQQPGLLHRSAAPDQIAAAQIAAPLPAALPHQRTAPDQFAAAQAASIHALIQQSMMGVYHPHNYPGYR